MPSEKKKNKKEEEEEKKKEELVEGKEEGVEVEATVATSAAKDNSVEKVSRCQKTSKGETPTTHPLRWMRNQSTTIGEHDGTSKSIPRCAVFDPSSRRVEPGEISLQSTLPPTQSQFSPSLSKSITTKQ